jgi:hypothetical protein
MLFATEQTSSQKTIKKTHQMCRISCTTCSRVFRKQDSIVSLKTKIFQSISVPVALQKLVLTGRVLKDDKDIGSSGMNCAFVHDKAHSFFIYRLL